MTTKRSTRRSVAKKPKGGTPRLRPEVLVDGNSVACAKLVGDIIEAADRQHELQLSWGGNWQRVLRFDPERRFEIEDAAAMLSRAAGGLKLRIVDAAGAARSLNEHGVFRASTLEK